MVSVKLEYFKLKDIALTDRIYLESYLLSFQHASLSEVKNLTKTELVEKVKNIEK